MKDPEQDQLSSSSGQEGSARRGFRMPCSFLVSFLPLAGRGLVALGSLGGALCLLGGVVCSLGGCSAATDVVAVDNSDPVATPAASPTDVGSLVPQDTGALGRLVVPPLPADPAPGSTTLIVAGMAVPDWQGPTFDWPLATPLRTFFADPPVSPAGDPSGTGGDSGASGSSNRGYGLGANGGYTSSYDNSRHVSDTHSKLAEAEHDAFQHLSTTDLRAAHDIHIVASTGNAAERLRGLFLEVYAAEHKDPSLVARDAWKDRYLVILEADSCGMPSAEDPAADPAAATDEACSKGARLDH